MLGNECVESCPNGFMPDEQLRCIKCDRFCEKSCDFGSIEYNESNYMSLPTGCTYVVGHVILNFGSFRGM